MRRRSIASLASSAALGLALAPLPAAASLIGDVVTVRLGYILPGETDFVELKSTDILIAVGTSDATNVYPIPSFPHIFDAEAFSFSITQSSTGWGEPFEFNGYRVEGLDFVGEPDRIITGVSFTSTNPDFTADRISFGDHEVFLDFQALSTPSVTISLQTTLIPEPATALLLGAGLLAFAGARRRA
jgi:hypothetical protein